MNKYTSTLIGAALAANVAYAGEAEFDEENLSDAATRAAEEMEQAATDAADAAADATEDFATGFADMTAEELDDVKVVLQDGEEIGEIDEVGYSASHGEDVAIVEIGGFLGIGEREIAVPVSQLTKTADGRAQISMSRQELEAAPEFDDDWLEVEEAE